MVAFVIAALEPVSELIRMLLLDAAAFTAVALLDVSLCGGQSSEDLSLAVDSCRTLCRAGLYLAGFWVENLDSTGTIQIKLVVGL